MNRPRFFYHAAPSDAREAIARDGLRGDPEAWGDIVWVWDDLQTALAYADVDEDVYRVDCSGLDVEPGGNPPSRHGGLAWAAESPIAADRCCLHKPASQPSSPRRRLAAFA